MLQRDGRSCVGAVFLSSLLRLRVNSALLMCSSVMHIAVFFLTVMLFMKFNLKT